MLQQVTEKPIDTAVLRDVDRAIAELRRGELLVLRDGAGNSALLQAAEGLTGGSLARLRGTVAAEPRLLLTPQRARRLDLVAGRPGPATVDAVVTLDTTGLSAEVLAELADPLARRPAGLAGEPMQAQGRVLPTPPLAAAAIALVKLARLLPAALLTPLEPAVASTELAWAEGLLTVSEGDVEAYGRCAARSLSIVAQARVPLSGAENTRIVAFRPADGGAEHLAIVIGTPQRNDAVLTRLHSECFTGDLLGSLRCDCGDQLRGALQVIAADGAGVLLYLAQEGRGIGLVNKLRAYNLQDLGADTFEANEQLGFDADERVYLPAAEMLRMLGFRRIRLLTNNPEKVAGLQRCGISVADRVAHSFPSNGHNEFYLATKAGRGGHLF